VRTLSCGGWVYITSSDDHDVHDVLMITYMGVLQHPVRTAVFKRVRSLQSSLDVGRHIIYPKNQPNGNQETVCSVIIRIYLLT
jgi:hypothetical protein